MCQDSAVWGLRNAVDSPISPRHCRLSFNSTPSCSSGSAWDRACFFFCFFFYLDIHSFLFYSCLVPLVLPPPALPCLSPNPTSYPYRLLDHNYLCVTVEVIRGQIAEKKEERKDMEKKRKKGTKRGVNGENRE